MIIASRLPEIIEQVSHVCGRDPRPCVSDVNRDVIAVGCRADGDASLLRCELDRITHDVADDLRHAQWIGAHRNAILGQDRLQLNLSLRRQRAERLLCLTENHHHRDVLDVEREFPRLETHCVQQISDETVHLPSRPHRHCEQLLAATSIEVFL